MNKGSLAFCIILLVTAQANSQNTDALRSNALAALGQFNPATALKDFTPNPAEINLRPEKGIKDSVAEVYQPALQSNETANFVSNQAKTRTRIKANPQAVEMRYAEQLIENADGVLDGACYKEPAHCHLEFIPKTCEDSVRFTTTACGTHLTLNLTTKTSTLARPILNWGSSATLNLLSCEAFNTLCTPGNLFTLSKDCQRLTVNVSEKGIPLSVLKSPTCSDPTLTIALPPYVGTYAEWGLRALTITVNEVVTSETWVSEDCNALESKVSTGACFKEAAPACTETNETHLVEGIALTRPCWGIKTQFHCRDGFTGNCDPLLKEGCSQSNSLCTQAQANQCTHYLQTFQCPTTACLPEQTICPGKIGCADGTCDSTKSEASTDFGEGVSRLAVLTQAASDVASLQIASHEAALFKGEAQECEKHPLGMRDCCTDKGFLDDLIHCPAEMKRLQQAKVEHRVAALGHYKNHTLGTTRYSFCIFPTTLAAIVQMQGRKGQLGISFGKAKKPDCRGLTPEELERIDFGALDLSALEKELTQRLKPVEAGDATSSNAAHIEQLYQQEKAHD